MAQFRHRSSGAQGRRAAKKRARALAAAGLLELKLVVAAATLDPLVQCNDISDDDVASPTRLAAALAELLPDMARCYAARLEEPRDEPKILYALAPRLEEPRDEPKILYALAPRLEEPRDEPKILYALAPRLEEPRDEPKILYALALPGSRTRLGGVTLADKPWRRL